MKYGAILADPPWRYDDNTCSGACEKHYPTMSLAEMKALPIKDYAAENCALFMWATFPKLAEALAVMAAWDFNYRTVAFVWIKTYASRTTKQLAISLGDEESLLNRALFVGTGRWARGNAEICLFGKRGKPQRQDENVRQIIIAPIRRHSQKPDEQYERIERLVDGPYLELFARKRHPGWDCWGNEVEPDIEMGVKP